MGFPAGMQLATIAFGIPLTATGKDVRTKVRVRPTSRVIWAATGQPLPEFEDSFSAEAGELGQFQVPFVDQPGFIDSAGNEVTDFAYRISASWEFGNERPISWDKNLKPLLGQTGPIDLDLVPDGPVSIPVTAPTASVLGFNGRTGFITLTDSDLPTRLSDAELSATYVPKWKPNTAYLAGEAVLSPSGDTVTAKVNFTSGSSFSATNWNYATITPAGVDTKLGDAAADSSSVLRQNLSAAFASNAMFDRKRTPRPPMTVLQGMTAGHAVTVPATTGTSNLNDTTDYALGDRSVTVTTPGDGNLFNLLRVTGQALDMTGKGIIIWMKLVNAQNLRGWFIDIGDNTFANYFRAQMNLPNGGKSPLYEGEWTPLWLPFSVFNYSKVGAPTKATITSLRMYFGDAGAGAPVTLKFGGLATYTEGVSRYPNGVASFTFDDSSAAQATFGAPYLAKYGYAGTMFPILDRIGTAGNYSLAQLRQVVDALGFELGAHASDNANHVSVIGRPQADLEAEFRKIRQWGFDNGFPSIMSYAYPVGPFDKSAVQAVRKYFGYGRTNDGKNVSPTSPHRYSASAVVLGSTVTLAAAKLAVDAAVADKTWVNFVVHGLVTSAPGSNDWLQSDFTALVDYCNSVGIPCAPVGDVIAVL